MYCWNFLKEIWNIEHLPINIQVEGSILTFPSLRCLKAQKKSRQQPTQSSTAAFTALSNVASVTVIFFPAIFSKKQNSDAACATAPPPLPELLLSSSCTGCEFSLRNGIKHGSNNCFLQNSPCVSHSERQTQVKRRDNVCDSATWQGIPWSSGHGVVWKL